MQLITDVIIESYLGSLLHLLRVLTVSTKIYEGTCNNFSILSSQIVCSVMSILPDNMFSKLISMIRVLRAAVNLFQYNCYIFFKLT